MNNAPTNTLDAPVRVERLMHETRYLDSYGQPHRLDGPAVIRPNGTLHWYRHGKLHREDGPAVVTPDGFQVWWLNGQMHREDGPASIHPDGRGAWYIHGRRELPPIAA